jgi:rubredoxin
MTDPKDMCQCQVTNCGFVYDPERKNRKSTTPLGVKFNVLPDTWKCPVCGASKHTFRPAAGPGSVIEDGS